MNLEPNIISVFQQIVTTESINKIAKEVNFVVRSTSRLKGAELVEALTFPTKYNTEESLNGLCDRLNNINPNIDVSAPALCQRINTRSCVLLFKRVFQAVLSKVRNLFFSSLETFENSVIRNFNNLFLEDSTTCSLNKKLSKKFEGNRRTTSEAQFKLDVIHNFSKEQIVNIDITSGNVPDQSLAHKILDYVNQNDLVIRDLGFFNLNVLSAISEKGAYYISRLPHHVLLYLTKESEKSLDLAKYIKKNYRNKKTIDLRVYVGAQRMPTRLVIYKLPTKVYKRIKLCEDAKAKKKNRQMSESKRSMLRYGIFITNVEANLLPAEVVGTIYRIRWEIELIFKQWKSKLKIHFIKGTCTERVECLIYSRLCLILFLSIFTQWATQQAWRMYKRELSVMKFIDYLQRGERLALAMREGKMEQLLKKLLLDIPRRLSKDKRSRLTTRERVRKNAEYYNDERFYQIKMVDKSLYNNNLQYDAA